MKKKIILKYPALFEVNSDGISISFPDIPGCLSCAFSKSQAFKMAKEAFSDAKIAKFLNENFISIKVDKEERPDIDTVYMEAALILTENAGWPLNMFLTPDMKPFFAGTYFPIDEKDGIFFTISKNIIK